MVQMLLWYIRLISTTYRPPRWLVTFEARNRVEAENWIKYQRRWMKDLKIVRNNDQSILDDLLTSYGEAA